MLIEEGFTLQKYQDLFFATMEEEELQEWTDRLPNHPKLPAKSVKKNRVSISPSDEEEEGEGYEVIGGSRGKCYGVICSVYLEMSNFHLKIHPPLIPLIDRILRINSLYKYIFNLILKYILYSSILQKEG